VGGVTGTSAGLRDGVESVERLKPVGITRKGCCGVGRPGRPGWDPGGERRGARRAEPKDGVDEQDGQPRYRSASEQHDQHLQCVTHNEHRQTSAYGSPFYIPDALLQET
jgi:hypothetical protein